MWLAPGTPYRDDDAVYAAIGRARESGLPLLGTCGGFQHIVGALAAAGVVICAHAPDAGVEGVELPDHPFLVATLFQPQVGSLAGRPLHPLIGAFLDAAEGRAAEPLDSAARRVVGT